MTITPPDYRSWLPEAAGRDAAFAAGYRAGLADGRHRRDRLVALAVVGAVLVYGRRVHPLYGLVVALALVVVPWPALVAVLVIEATVRQHRRHRSWPRTAAYAVSWLVGLGLLLLAAVHRSAWPLVGAAALVVAWTAGPRVLTLTRRHRGRGPETPGPGGVDPSWPPPDLPSTDADRTLGPRRYCDGHVAHVDTCTGEPADDPFATL